MIPVQPGLLLNPNLDWDQKKYLTENFFKFRDSGPQGSYWFASSGSQGIPKLVCLTEAAMCASANAVNQIMGLTSEDIFLNVLPKFHVGGLATFFRAQELSSFVIDADPFGWDPIKFSKICSDNQITVTSLVPTQIFDLVQKQMISPKSLRCIFVGGAALNPDLYFAAVKLGWKLYPTFGMTEVASQIATAVSVSQDQYPQLKILNHIQAQVLDGLLMVRSAAVCEGYVENESWIPVDKHLGLKTSDQVLIDGGYLKPLGRSGETIKINGELVSLFKLRNQFEDVLDFAVTSLPDSRTGAKIIGVVGAADQIAQAKTKIEAWNKSCMPLERIKKLVVLNGIPKSNLGKVLYSEITQTLITRKDITEIDLV
jgi:O-succinylbenzoic acid--CoA ligase